MDPNDEPVEDIRRALGRMRALGQIDLPTLSAYIDSHHSNADHLRLVLKDLNARHPSRR